MSLKQKITPSAEARQLFSQMVVRADRCGSLGIEQAISLGVERCRKGKEASATSEIHELVSEGWIAPDNSNGGWFVAPGGGLGETD